MQKNWIEPRFGIITAVVLAIVVYGSIFPFDFYANPNPAGPFAALIATRGTWGGRGDVLANILLYAPLGFFSVLAWRRGPRAGPVLLTICAGCVISTSIELIQFYDRGRDSSLSDVYANAAGMALGAIMGAVLHRKVRLAAMGNTRRHAFVVLLLACWLGYRLYPYVPTIDLHKYWHSVRPLLFTSSLPILDLYRHTVAWLAIALLIETLAGTGRGTLIFLLSVPAVLVARILMTDVILSPAETAGGIIAMLAWVVLFSRLRTRAVWIAVMFGAGVVIQGLEPFHFSAATHLFGWVPFRGFMRGSMATNVPSFFEKAFTYGALTWLLTRAGCSLAAATVMGGALVLSLRLAQVYIPGRSAEITDVMMLVMLAGAMKLMSGESGRSASATIDMRGEILRGPGLRQRQ